MMCSTHYIVNTVLTIVDCKQGGIRIGIYVSIPTYNI